MNKLKEQVAGILSESYAQPYTGANKILSLIEQAKQEVAREIIREIESVDFFDTYWVGTGYKGWLQALKSHYLGKGGD